ncbi:terminase gpP N-terminus-related DNA-binding protein [Klebsiella pneumoniae]|uniref:terminase gpP N-terminus-related DNA-binding protein n=1 Tax=Escherichia coli TaxID=562 RepID=UPI00351CEBB8|nr:hypothetical protein [Klebsiella pneumoniae]
MAGRNELRATAKTLYESGRMTIKQVAEEIGMSSRTVERWSAADGWQRIKTTPELSERAHRVASRLAEIPEDAKPEERAKSVEAVTEQQAVDERAELLVRHRREWQVTRALLAEAVRERSNDKAKMAKVVAETTAITQKGERLAWGLDTEAGTKVQVIIERE